jgi:hypothetical protein
LRGTECVSKGLIIFNWQCLAVERTKPALSMRGFWAYLKPKKPTNLAKRGGCWFVREGLRVHLGVGDDFRPARKAHPAFLVEDLSGLRTLLEASGVMAKVDEPLEGYDRIYVHDPFGNRLELLEPASN